MKLLIRLFFLTFILLFAFNIYGQHGDKKILLIKIRKDKSLDNSKQVKLRIGDKVCLKFKSDSVIRGKIEQITDSTISMKGWDFPLKNITRINRTGTGTLLAIGLPMTAIGLVAIDIMNSNPYMSLEFIIYPVLFVPVGILVTIAGIITEVSWRRFYIDKYWNIFVTTDDL